MIIIYYILSIFFIILFVLSGIIITLDVETNLNLLSYGKQKKSQKGNK